MDEVFDHIVEWFDGKNGPFRLGFEKKSDAVKHAELVGGKHIDNTEEAQAARAAHQEAVDASTPAPAEGETPAA